MASCLSDCWYFRELAKGERSCCSVVFKHSPSSKPLSFSLSFLHRSSPLLIPSCYLFPQGSFYWIGPVHHHIINNTVSGNTAATQSIQRLSINTERADGASRREWWKWSPRRLCYRFIAIFTGLSLVTFTDTPLPFCCTTGLPEGPTFPSRLHVDLWAEVASTGCGDGCGPDMVLFSTGKVSDAVEQHLRVGFVLTGSLGQRARDVTRAKHDTNIRGTQLQNVCKAKKVLQVTAQMFVQRSQTYLKKQESKGGTNTR